jgi:NAD(P)-dependent dehydrogenase (short-subunit alcohol dehydrogenase family)
MSTSSSRPLALVTGASTGIGLELAKQFATNGFDLVITARSDALDDAVRTLQPLGGSVEAVRVDLASDEGVDQLWGRVQELERPVSAAALNAGRGAGGAFTDIELVDELEIIDLNIRSTVHLAKHLVRDMSHVTRDASSSRRPSHRLCRGPSRRSTTPLSPSCSPSHSPCATSSRTSEMEPLAVIAAARHELDFLRPARPGDRLSMTVACAEKRASRSKPDRGTVRLESELKTTDGSVTARLSSHIVLARRHAD